MISKFLLWLGPGVRSHLRVWRMFSIKAMFQICLSYTSSLGPQEARGNTSRWTRKLASYANNARNHARDFYRNNPLPVESTQMETAWLLCFGTLVIFDPYMVRESFMKFCGSLHLRSRPSSLSFARTTLMNPLKWSYQSFCLTKF